MRPDSARALLVLAHGAGAGMRHRFMEELAQRLGRLGVATLRYQFPYMEKGSKRPDSLPTLVATVRAAVRAAAQQAPDLPLFAGGKSMGGRISALAAAQEPLDAVRGLIFFGFPLHAAKKPSAERAEPLLKIPLPMLFFQGTRDALADLSLLKPFCERLGGRAELFIIEGGDHSFHVPKSSGRFDAEVLGEVAEKVGGWVGTLISKP